MKKPSLAEGGSESLQTSADSQGQGKQHVISQKAVEALREKAIVDSGKAQGEGPEKFDFKRLQGLSFTEAIAEYPRLLQIMLDVVSQVASTLPDEIEAATAPKHTDENAPAFAGLLKDAAQWFYRNGHHDHALKAAEGALKFLSDDGDLYVLVADIYYSQENYKDAGVTFEKALTCFHDQPDMQPVIKRKLADVYVKLAELFFDYGQERAVECYRNALIHVPQYIPALCGLGDLAFFNRDFKIAQEFYERVMDIDPSSVRALHGLANIHTVYGYDDEAEALFTEAVSKSPFNLPVLYDMADFQFRCRENYRRAQYYIDRAFGVENKNVPIMMLKIEIALKLQDFDTAQLLVERVLQIDPMNKKAYEHYCRLVNGECFLPPQFGSSFKAVKPNQQHLSRDFYFSLQYQNNPGDEGQFEDYVIKVAKASGDKLAKFKSKYDGWLLN